MLRRPFQCGKGARQAAAETEMHSLTWQRRSGGVFSRSHKFLMHGLALHYSPTLIWKRTFHPRWAPVMLSLSTSPVVAHCLPILACAIKYVLVFSLLFRNLVISKMDEYIRLTLLNYLIPRHALCIRGALF